MKTHLLLLSVALAAASAPAQVSSRNADFKSVKINETVAPAFPESLYRAYRNGGEVRLDIAVDAEGKLSDSLLVAYPDRRFADLALEAVKQWTFEPARWKDEPIPVCISLTFNFEVSGVVISTSGNELIDARLNEIFGGPNAYRPSTLSELDRIPIPLRADAPHYPKSVADRGVSGEVSIEFYIDEHGAVRMPFVVGLPQMELAHFAMTAVREWKFEPPTRKGQPVLARVRQLFRFKPAP